MFLLLVKWSKNYYLQQWSFPRFFYVVLPVVVIRYLQNVFFFGSYWFDDDIIYTKATGWFGMYLSTFTNVFSLCIIFSNPTMLARYIDLLIYISMLHKTEHVPIESRLFFVLYDTLCITCRCYWTIWLLLERLTLAGEGPTNRLCSHRFNLNWLWL